MLKRKIQKSSKIYRLPREKIAKKPMGREVQKWINLLDSLEVTRSLTVCSYSSKKREGNVAWKRLSPVRRSPMVYWEWKMKNGYLLGRPQRLQW